MRLLDKNAVIQNGLGYDLQPNSVLLLSNRPRYFRIVTKRAGTVQSACWMWYGVDDSGSETQQEQEIFVLTISLRASLRPIQPLLSVYGCARGKSGTGANLTIHLHTAPRLRKTGAILLCPIHAFMVQTGKILPGHTSRMHKYSRNPGATSQFHTPEWWH